MTTIPSKFNLAKAVEKTKFVLQKRNVSPAIRAAIVKAIDVSGSTKDLYQRGTMQKAVERVLPVGLTFDDNGALDVYTFSRGDMIAHLPEATAQNYDGYVAREILGNSDVPKWDGTSYAPVLEAILRDFGFYTETKSGGFLGIGAKTTVTLGKDSNLGFPVIVYFATDGANDDKRETERLLQKMQDAGCRIYILFIGVGNEDFEFIRRMADKFSNTGFLNVTDIDRTVEDDGLYELLIPEELSEWLKK